MATKYPHLFQPIVIAKQKFRNRIFNSPTGQPVENLDYYERKAVGGAASVCIGDASPSSTRLSRDLQINLWDGGQKRQLTDIAYAITRHGAVASMEILDSGNCSYYSASVGHPLLGPVDGVSPFGQEIHEMTEEQILAAIEDHAKAALYVKKLGFGMVTVHGGHGWLITQFLDKSNNRKDKWGGTPENRARLAVAIADRIHQVCGRGFPVEMRMVGDEVYEHGYHIEEGISQAKFLDGHVDLIHVSAGSHEVNDVFTVTHPSMFLEDGPNVKYAAEIKKHVTGTPIATVGGLSEPELLEEIIASGKADVVELARGLICDPDLPVKLRTGRDDEVRKCMRCLLCFSNHMQTNRIICAINPEIGHEKDSYFAPCAKMSKKILVAGGGMGGMQAALSAAKDGHKVILCEKRDRLGGALLCEEKVSFKEKLSQYIELQARLISREPNIEVRLNTEVTPAVAEEIKPDVIIAALGARPIVPTFIKGYDLPHVFGAEEIYYNPEKAGDNVVFLGGGLVGLELAIHLSQMGKKCTIIEMMPNLNDGGNNLHGLAISTELRKYGIKVSTATRALEITEKGVIGEFTGAEPKPGMRFGLPCYYPEAKEGTKLFEADTVVYSVGQRPLWEEADALRECAPEYYELGDCVNPKNIWAATHTAHYLVRDIGRY